MAQGTKNTKDDNAGDEAGMHAHDADFYPLSILQAGHYAMVVYDRVEQGLLADGFTQDEATLLLALHPEQILAQAAREEGDH